MTLPPLFDGHFPNFVKETFKDVINVFWYGIEFSQSRYPPGQKKSAACTLICIFIAQQICKTRMIIQSEEQCQKLNLLLAEAIVRGNATHEWITSQRLVSHLYLNAEEALKYGGKSLNILKEWEFRVFHQDIKNTLYKNIKDFLHQWYRQPKSPNLFMLLISGGRTVLFVFQQTTSKVTMFDSHSHSTSKYPNRGLVLAQTNINQLKLLCEWFIQDISISCFNYLANQYELTFLFSDE